MDKRLKKLSRVELLELMVQLSEECDKLAFENDQLKQQLSQRRLPRNAKVGSIAEAALQANGYFEAAQKSADEYLREIKYLRDELVLRSNRSPEEARQAVIAAREQSQGKMRAQAAAQQILEDARTRANQIIASAQSQARTIIQEANKRTRACEVQPIATENANQRGTQTPRQQTRQPVRSQERVKQQTAQGNRAVQSVSRPRQQGQQAQQMRHAQRPQQVQQTRQQVQPQAGRHAQQAPGSNRVNGASAQRPAEQMQQAHRNTTGAQQTSSSFRYKSMRPTTSTNGQ